MSTKKFNNLKNATGTIIKRAREEKKMSKKRPVQRARTVRCLYQ